MKKFTESTESTEEESGHWDVDGTWKKEPYVEKIRNRLTSFWTLPTLLLDKDVKEKLFTDPKIQKMLFDIAKSCEDNKEIILNYLSELSKIEEEKRVNDKKGIQ